MKEIITRSNGFSLGLAGKGSNQEEIAQDPRMSGSIIKALLPSSCPSTFSATNQLRPKQLITLMSF